MQKKYIAAITAGMLVFTAVFSSVCPADTDDDIFSELEENIEAEDQISVKLHSDITCTVDGKPVQITGCAMKDNRVYVPIKPIFEAMGFKVTYSPKVKQVGLVQGSTKILLDLNRGIISGILYANNKSVEINSVLDDNVELNGVVYIPVRNITESMYCKVDWNQDALTVAVNSPSLADVAVEQKDNTDISQYVGDNTTEFYRGLIPVLLDISKTADFNTQMGLIDKILALNTESNVEIETSRVFSNFKTKMVAVRALNDKPVYNDSVPWTSESYPGYDTYRASVVELNRLADRLMNEGLISDSCVSLITTISSTVKAEAIGQ